MPEGRGRDKRGIFRGNRRSKVAALLAEGMSQRKIAKELDMSKSTVARDAAWLKKSEHLLRAREAADDIIEGELVSDDTTDIITLEGSDLPTNFEEYREHERGQVAEMVARRKTYAQIADLLGISVRTVVNHVNSYLEEYGDFGGRTMLNWRNEHLLKSYELMSTLEDDMNCQPIPSKDGSKTWALTPFQAQRTRDAARKRYMELMKYQAQLLQLLVTKTEVDVNQKIAVVTIRNIDGSVFPEQTAAQIAA